MIAFAGAKKAEENSKRVRTINGLAKDPLKELIIKSTPVPEKRTSSFSKSAKVCNVSHHCCFAGCAVKAYVRLKYLDSHLLVF